MGSNILILKSSAGSRRRPLLYGAGSRNGYNTRTFERAMAKKVLFINLPPNERYYKTMNSSGPP